MNPEQSFVFTLNDLQEHVERKTAYHIIRAAGLLRHLLLDNPRLLDLANHRIHEIVRFRVLDTGVWASAKSESGEFELWSNVIVPAPHDTYEDGFLNEATLDEFLKIHMFKWKEYSFDIKEVIRFAAHIQGGVHHGKPRSQQEFAQKDLSDKETILGQPMYVSCLVQIALVVLQSLAPLKQKIIDSDKKQFQGN